MSTQVTTRRVKRTIIGTAVGIANALQTADRQGRLVAVTPPRPHAPGQFAVTAVLIEPTRRPAQRPATPRRVPARYWVALAAVTAAIGVLAAIGYVLAVLVQWIAAHLAVILGAAVVLVVVALVLASTTGRCVGLHCPGCGHR